MLGSGAFAVLAGAVGRKLQVLFRAEHGGPQIYGELFELIAARLATWYRTVAGTSTEGVEELAEHVAHVESAEGLAATVSRSARGSFGSTPMSNIRRFSGSESTSYAVLTSLNFSSNCGPRDRDGIYGSSCGMRA